jgi:hypothetical protein
MFPITREARKAGEWTLGRLLGTECDGIATARGGQWHATSVQNVLERARLEGGLHVTDSFWQHPAFAGDSRKHPQQLKEHEEKNMKRNTLVRETYNDVLWPYVLAMAIKDDIAAEVTAMAMGWVPVDREDGTTIWVRLKDIGVDDVSYCDTALEVVRTYTH